MPPRCHQSKKDAIFQLCNLLCTKSVSEITDLANGEILYRTLQARFPPFSEDQSSEVDVLRNSTNGIRNENSINESNPATKDNDIFLQHIKKFIDAHYNIKSETIIEYEKCINFDELEILKLAVFVLSEIIKHLVLETNSDDLGTLFHIEIKFQIELEAIFELFISEREKLNKEEVEKLLSKTSKKVSPFATPRRTSTRHREQFTNNTSIPKEDIFTNSPLKTYFESPVFKKEGIWMKEKVKNYEKTLAEGDEEVSNLASKITKLENDLKNKEKDLKCLQKKLDDKEEENQILLSDIESLKAQQESLSKEVTRWKNDYELIKFRTIELSSEMEQLQKVIIKEEQPNSVKRRSSSQLHLNSLLNAKEEEITQLKEIVKNLEMKNLSYKNKLVEEIFAELQEKKSRGLKNQSYEEVWHEVEVERLEREELLSTIIVADNRDLSAKLNISLFENKRLLKEIENLKKKLAGKNRKSGTTELKDTSKTPDTEKFRKSFNENSYILNNSDYITCEQSVISSEPEALPCSAESSGAVLWKMYDSQKSETEDAYDIHLNHDSVIPENDLQLSNIKIENINPDSLLNRENNYVLGNLNFNNFLNELKKLTKNGSFQKVLQVFGKRRKEMSGTNGCNRLDLQVMLQMITDCLCEAAALNAESSLLDDREDKCCSTDDKELCTVIELNIALDKLKNQLRASSQKHEIDLKTRTSELQELKQEKVKLENKYQTSAQVISEKKKAFEELYRKYREHTMKMENLNRKYFELKKSYELLLDENKKLQGENSEIRKISLNVCKKKRYYEKLHKLSQEENSKLREELLKFKEENKNLLKEKEAWSVRSATYLRDSLPSRDSCMGLPNHLPTKSESQDSVNESVLSGAFHKNLSHYVSENEDDFCYYNSLNAIKKEYDDERVEEIKRRNSLYPRQLQSSYPLEADLNATYHSLYVQDKCREQQQHSKKLKLGDVTEEPSLFETPISKPKKKLETPLSFQRLMKRVKCKKIPIKPKGSS